MSRIYFSRAVHVVRVPLIANMASRVCSLNAAVSSLRRVAAGKAISTLRHCTFRDLGAKRSVTAGSRTPLNEQIRRENLFRSQLGVRAAGLMSVFQKLYVQEQLIVTNSFPCRRRGCSGYLCGPPARPERMVQFALKRKNSIE